MLISWRGFLLYKVYKVRVLAKTSFCILVLIVFINKLMIYESTCTFQTRSSVLGPNRQERNNNARVPRWKEQHKTRYFKPMRKIRGAPWRPPLQYMYIMEDWLITGSSWRGGMPHRGNPSIFYSDLNALGCVRGSCNEFNVWFFVSIHVRSDS